MRFLDFIAKEYRDQFFDIIFNKPTLKIWFESRFTYLPPEILNQCHIVANRFESDNKIIKAAFNHHTKVRIGDIQLQSQVVPVYAGYTIGRSEYDKDYQRIIIQFNNDSRAMMEDLLHEVGHLLDKGLNYKKQPKENPKTDAELTAYATNPGEFDAIGTYTAQFIKAIFETKRNVADRLKIIELIKNSLRQGGDDIPYVDPEYIKRWKTNPFLWRKFQQRMYNLLKDLENDINEIGSQEAERILLQHLEPVFVAKLISQPRNWVYDKIQKVDDKFYLIR
jgi:hypothetical protein